MLIEVLKSKIHNAAVTKKELYYHGSIGIDRVFMLKSRISANQKVQVVNFNSGARFETYVIEEPQGSGEIALYGPAARLAEIGDRVCIMAYALIEQEQAESFKPEIVVLKDNNKLEP